MDVQEAYLGIGIIGKEGKQAADFSILEFRVIKLLLLWHGRLSYKRGAVLSQFVIYRWLIISIIHIIFSFMFILLVVIFSLLSVSSSNFIIFIISLFEESHSLLLRFYSLKFSSFFFLETNFFRFICFKNSK